MRVVVVGAGVMGLSAARVLAERGHHVHLLDRFGVGNTLASSSGATRIWRLAHPDRERVRLAKWNRSLWQRIEQQAAQKFLLENGLFWLGGEAPEVASALAAEGVPYELLDESGQRERFPELRWQEGRLVVWQPEAGTLLAAAALGATADAFANAGGELSVGAPVHSVDQRSPGGVRVVTETGGLDADVAVVAPGPWANEFLGALGSHVRLEPVLEQITYVRGGSAGWEIRPSLIEPPDGGGSFGLYALPTPGIGFKVGIDTPLRDFDPAAADRTPDQARERWTLDRIQTDLPGLDPTPVRSEICGWTSSPDDLFILDRVGDVVIGCGDGGQGFKFLPMIGEVLADLAEDKPPHADTEIFRLSRFG